MKRLLRILMVTGVALAVMGAGTSAPAADRDEAPARRTASSKERSVQTKEPAAKSTTVADDVPAAPGRGRTTTVDRNRDSRSDQRVVQPVVPQPVTPAVDDAADAQQAPNFNLDWYSVNNGGDIEVVGTNFRMGISVGQTAVGEVAAGPFKMGFGFWYGAAGSAGGCSCPNQADVAPIALGGDGAVNLLDIVAIIDYVYRSGPALADDPDCPRERADVAPVVTCGDGMVNLLDIVNVIDYVYRSGPPPCDPCTT